MKKDQKIYLDYAATTPVDPRVVKTMEPYLNKKFGNTASLHSFGMEAKEALEKSRKIIADTLKAKAQEIIFTSSATESNNLALKGPFFAEASKDKPRGHAIVSGVEHDCVLESAHWLKKQGFKITILPVDQYGMVKPKDVEQAIKKDTILVSVMHGNNEIGTINPITEIGKICKKHNVLFHTDAAQTFGKLPIDVNRMNIDLLTASSHKMYGPKGVAILYVRTGTKIEPIIHGGGHENGLRSSTVNLPAIVGFAKAVEIYNSSVETRQRRNSRVETLQCNVSTVMKSENLKLQKLRDKLIKGILKNIKDVKLNGHPKLRLANNVNFRFKYIEGEAIVMMLDALGIATSTGSACSSPKLQASHVLLACGIKQEEAHGSLRISLGRWTT